ncbi:MAG: acyl-CoA dehydratase activase-related protein [Blautia sp.]
MPNLFAQREKLLFQDYPVQDKAPDRGITVGIPRVLYFWDSMPFWTTFLRALGFGVVLSKPSSREMYESGLAAVTSDTVCFPAKLVHGHLRDLAKRGVDRIFMPSVTTLPTENREKNSESMCAVVKGYPIVIRNSDDPQSQWGIPFDAPLFHWHTQEDRRRQITQYMRETFALPVEQIRKALQEGDRAQESFRRQLKMAGQAVLDEVERTGKYAVVLASRPYQNDPLVNHHLPEMFTDLGIPVLTADSLPEIESQDLSKSRLDVVNNYHARMLSSAMTAAASDHLEYVQIVSFGCGHDAYLSDEIIRLMREISGKTPLILKVDESDIQGPLQIRVRSFVETVRLRRQRADELEIRELTDPYPVKYTKEDRMDRTILVPNTSHAFSRIMAAAFSTQGTRAVPLEVGRDEAIRLGKKYVHNDICFPAQIVIGEALAALESGEYDPDHVAVGMGKYIGNCRLTHYSALLRKALDDAGYPQVPIMTNDDADDHDLHPGFRMNLHTAATIAFALPMVDVLEELLRKIRPYEEVPGSTEKAFERAMDQVVDGMQTQGIRGLKKGFERAIEIMGELSYDRSRRRPEVLIVGEYLLNFHPGANHDIEAYLEQNGFEVVEARMTDVIRKSYFCRDAQNREFKLDKGISEKSLYYIENRVFDLAHDLTDKIARRHPLYSPACRLPKLVKKSDEIIYHTFDAGEGVLIPGEIIHHAEAGCKNFVILQPFGCLPNHVVGRGIVKKLKERYPDAQILPLDYDPDVSFANIENRLQMLVMNMAGTQSEGTREDVKKAGRKKAVGGKMQPNFHAG